jgi:DNA-binding beta-propeller fold protein YncE
MRRRSTLAGLAVLLAVLSAAPAQATGVPAWDVRAMWGDTNLPPGGGGLGPGSLLRFHQGTYNWQRATFNAAPAQPAGVAVDPANGNVYVVDLDSFATGGATLRTYDAEGDEAAAPCPLGWAPGTPLPQPALDAAGDLYYPNTATGAVQKLGPGCAEAPLAHPIGGLTDPNGVALDSAGNVYVVDGTTGGSDIAAGRLTKYAPDGTPLGTFKSGEVTSVAIDRPTGEVFLGRGWGSSFHIQRYSSTGTLLEDFGAGAFATRSPSNYAHEQLALIYNQLAVDETDKAVYAANPASLGETEAFKREGGAYVHSPEPLVAGSLTAAVAVNQASREVYAANVASLQDLAQFAVQARAVGTAPSRHALTITDQLPRGVTATHVEWGSSDLLTETYFSGEYVGTSPVRTDLNQLCSGVGTETVTCVLPEKLETSESGGLIVKRSYPAQDFSTDYQPGQPGWPHPPRIYIDVEVAKDAAGTGANVARVEGGDMAQPFIDEDEVPFSDTPAPFGIVRSSFAADNGSFASDVFTAAYPFGQPSRQAGDHPFEYHFDFELNQYSAVSSFDGTRNADSTALLRTIEATLPRGLIGNPQVMPKCDPLDFVKPNSPCPSDTQVGYIHVSLGGGNSGYGHGGEFPCSEFVPIYNLTPPRGTPIDYALNVCGFVVAHIYAALDPAQDYAIKAVAPDTSILYAIDSRAAELTLWGVPGDPAHDSYRRYPEEIDQGPGKEKIAVGAPWGSAPIRPLFTNPMDCGFNNGGHRIRAESYMEPGVFTAVQEYPDPLNVTGCEDPRFRFGPEVTLQPTDRHAGAPTGLDVHLKVPLRNDEVSNAEDLYATEGDGALKEEGPVKAIATPPIKKAVVTLPEGMTLNPSAAQGLVGCTEAQIGLGTNRPVTCPDSSQYGTLVLHTPLLPVNEQPSGFIYIARQNENPFHNFLSIYLVIEEPDRGVLVKIPGRLDLNPVTGQITTSFDELPQFPVSDMQMTFKGGVRAGLVEPTTCGTKTIRAEFFTWQDPSTPHLVTDHYDITQRPDGSPCVTGLAQRPFKPALQAGTLNPTAGAYSPFAMRLTRSDDDQEFSQLGVTLPPGLAAKFAGVGICPDSGIAQALSRETVAGDGALEQADPSCPASSQIGTTEVGTGVGVPLTYVPGKVYLSGPYRGAPMSLVVISPAIVGPYDLGVITVRTALNVNPTTAQGEALSDPFPQIFQGIPVRIRDIRLKLDRPNFTLNPTSCAPKQIQAHITGTGGNLASTADDTAANLETRYQAADCASLPFKPSLSFHLYGGTHRGSHPRLKALLTARPGDANIASARVTLPHSEFLDQGHLNNICTRVQFAAKSCPPASVYGHAEAITPLFDHPLQGPVYLRSNPEAGRYVLPNLVAVLRGPDSQPVEVDLVGRIDSVKLPHAEGAGIRNSFEVVPDAPVTSFTLEMEGGGKGLLQNSTDLCAQTYRATAAFTAQNGKAVTLRPAMRSACRKGHGKHRHRRLK